VLDTLETEGLLKSAETVGDILKGRLKAGLSNTPGVVDIRGQGLMLGIELDRPCGDLVKMALEEGLLINVTRDRVVRLLPPLILTEAQAQTLAYTLVPLIKTFLSSP
jgi:acetylornithine aminotransferase